METKNKRRMPAHEGQSLAFIAMFLAFVTPFIFAAVDIFERQAQIAQAEDALRNAARVGVQSFRYANFAANDVCMHEETARSRAHAAFRTNLSTQRAFDAHSVDQLLQRTIWHARPQGGTIVFGDNTTRSFTTPTICGETTAFFRGIGLTFAPVERRISACATLDRF
jgi:hypothetical protein